ncbi:MAG: hypothetical protein ABJB47_04840 [Actinomycetota bacterium]
MIASYCWEQTMSAGQHDLAGRKQSVRHMPAPGRPTGDPAPPVPAANPSAPPAERPVLSMRRVPACRLSFLIDGNDWE